MSIQSVRELENTRAKLRLIEERYEAMQRETAPDEHVRELTLHSLKRVMNQLKEEMIRFECRLTTRSGSPSAAERGSGQ